MLGAARRTEGYLLSGAFALLLVSPGCDALATLIEEATETSDPEELAAAARELEEPEEEEALPERPADSIARSETSVITFKSILDNSEMSRAERIRAFQNLDPGALQKRVAQPNVSGAPQPATPTRRRPSASTTAPAKAKPARPEVPIVMYSTAWCGVCKRARRYMQEQGIPFTEYDVDTNVQARNEYLLLNPRRSVPTLKIGNEVVVGFSPAALEGAMLAAAR